MSTGLRAFGDLRLSYDLRAVPQALKTIASSDSYVEYDFASPYINSYWVTMRIALPTEGFDAQLLHLTRVADQQSFYLVGGKWGSDITGDFDSPVPTYAAYHLIEIQRDTDAAHTKYYIDGTLAGEDDLADTRETRLVTLGVFQGNPGDTMYCERFAIGTARAGTDLFFDDFSTGDLSGWTSSSGSVSVVQSPF